MDMTDDKLLEEFFMPARNGVVADNGFTERVMNSLPAATHARDHRAALFSRLWTCLCVAVAAVLFFVIRGWEPIFNVIRVIITTPPTTSSMLMFLVSAAVVGFVLLGEVINHERSVIM
jgi:hypothetical protein